MPQGGVIGVNGMELSKEKFRMYIKKHLNNEVFYNIVTMEVLETLLFESFKLEVGKYMGKWAAKDNLRPVLEG